MMEEKTLNKTLHIAKSSKKDEFYTQLSDIETELKHYKAHFENKVIFCNCDDPVTSNFFKYFVHNFKHLKLKKLIATCYKNQEPDFFCRNKPEKAVFIAYDGSNYYNKFSDLLARRMKPLLGDGDFRSKECIDLLKQSDIVITNQQLMKAGNAIERSHKNINDR
jgi:hypothetical protein